MSWLFRETALRIPPHPGGAIAEPVWIGRGSDAGFFRFQWAGSPVISAQFGYSLIIDSDILLPVLVSYDGYMAFEGSDWGVWHDPAYDWIAARRGSVSFGYPVLEFYVNSAYEGSSFYSGYCPSLGGSATFTARGSLRGQAAITVSTSWARWTAPSGGYGAYSASGTASGSKIFGTPAWGSSAQYPRSVAKDGTGHYAYGAIGWNSTAGKFILGSYGSAAGWHEAASDPTAGDAWTLSFAQPTGGAATGADLNLPWRGYIQGAEKKTIHLFSAATWKDKA